MSFRRILDLATFLARKSYFLFGPRSIGKTHLIKKTLKNDAHVISLLNPDYFLRLATQPSLLTQMIAGSSKPFIVIDEIQKLPILLDVVQEAMENSDKRFLLTGSSARKLKRENANLLGGRAGTLMLHPLTSSEIPNFDLKRYLRFGGIPPVVLSDEPLNELSAYVGVYLEQEIKAESTVRNLIPFSRFLKSAAHSNAELVNFANIGSDSGLSPSTVREYYSVLEDTLIGFLLEPFIESRKRKAIQTAKFYFFDPGVCHYIMGIESLDRNSNLWGKAFEQFIAMELRAYLSYRRKRSPLTFWRSTSKHEVDFVIGHSLAIEVKATSKLSKRDFLSLSALKEEGLHKRFILVSNDPIARKEGSFECIPWKIFLMRLWSDEFVIP